MTTPTFTVTSAIPDSTDDALRYRLPPRAAEKFIALRDAADAAAAAREQASDRRLELREEVGRLRLELRAHTAPGRPESREAQGTRAAIERRQQEMDRLERIADRRAAEVARNRDLLRRAYEALGDVPASRIRAVEVEPKVKKGESLQDALARVRGEIADVAAERRQVEAAPLPSSFVRQQMAAQVEALAAEGRLDVTGLFYGRTLELPRLIQAATPKTTLPAFETLPTSALSPSR